MSFRSGGQHGPNALPAGDKVKGKSAVDQMKSALNTRTARADLKDVPESTVVSFVKAQIGQSHVPHAHTQASNHQFLLLNNRNECSIWYSILQKLKHFFMTWSSWYELAALRPVQPLCPPIGHRPLNTELRLPGSLGRLHDPFCNLPYQAFVVSPLGAFLKRDTVTKIRLIHDL